MMTEQRFLRRLESGRVVTHRYRKADLVGMIQIWKHGAGYVLTWEECKDGDQLDESAFTIDDRKLFPTLEDVRTFLRDHHLDPSAFTP